MGGGCSKHDGDGMHASAIHNLATSLPPPAEPRTDPGLGEGEVRLAVVDAAAVGLVDFVIKNPVRVRGISFTLKHRGTRDPPPEPLPIRSYADM